MSSSARLLVTESQVLSTAYSTIAITTVFTFARFGVRLTQQKREFQIEDGFCLFSWVAFIVMAILYIVVTPVLYRVDTAISTDTLYPEILKDSLFLIEIFFANTIIFWIVLWSVKLSLLFLYKRLFTGLPSQMKWWWAVFIFTILVCTCTLASIQCPRLASCNLLATRQWMNLMLTTAINRCYLDVSFQTLPRAQVCTLGLPQVCLACAAVVKQMNRNHAHSWY